MNNLESKYAPKEEVWIMHRNRPFKTNIARVVFTQDLERTSVTYDVYYCGNVIEKLKEDEIFTSKEELIISL